MRNRRLAPYLYVIDLYKGRRVLEIGCDNGAGAALLARNGATHVLAVDRSAHAIQEALLGQSRPNLEYRLIDYGAMSLPDKSFDVVFVPEATDLIGWLGFLEEVRRVTVVGGHVVFTARSGDRPERRGGLSYHDMVERLEPLFGPVRMVGMAPFNGYSLVEFANDEAEVPELELDTSLHPADPATDIVEYLAVAGPLVGPTRGYLLVQTPTEKDVRVERDRSVREPVREPEAIAPLQARLTRAVEERDALETEVAALRTRVVEAEGEIGRVHAEAAREVAEARRAMGEPPAGRSPEEARRELGQRDRERELEALLCERQELAWRVSELEGRLAAQARGRRREPTEPVEVLLEAAARHAVAMQEKSVEVAELLAYVEELRSERDQATAQAKEAQASAGSAAAALATAEGQLREMRERAARSEGELLKRATPAPAAAPVAAPAPAPAPAPDAAPRLAELEQSLEKANARWKQAESKSDELWRKVGEMQRELESHREQAVETARQQRHAAQVALTRAMDEASKKLVSVKDEASRGERERKQLEARLAEAHAEVERARAVLVETQRGREEAREELETIRVMSAQGYLEVRQEILRAREQASEEVERSRVEVEACRSREQRVLTRLAELEETLRTLATGLHEEEQRLGALEDGIRTVHQDLRGNP